MTRSHLKRAAQLSLTLATLGAPALAQLVTTDLGSGLTPSALVNSLLGGAVSVSNVNFVGTASAAGKFTGGTGILGFDAGIVLSSGSIANVTSVGGVNQFDDVTTDNNLPGDVELDALIPGYSTFDATVLEFDFDCPNVNVVSFEYVFSSEEYNEWVNTSYNDVFGFFVNGVNVALLPDGVTPVSINNVNAGNPVGTGASNPAFYVDNSCADLPTSGGVFPCVPFVQTEMDGLTVVLTVFTSVNPGLNHIKLAIADAGDHILDSNVFIKAHTFTCAPPCNRPVNYCTAKVNSLGCIPEVELTDSPSATGLTVSMLEAQRMIGNMSGVFLHSTQGAQSKPFHGGRLCLRQPLFRHTIHSTGGTSGACNGHYEEDFNAYVAAGIDPALVAGSTVWLQAWSRDPADPYSDSLSDAVEATICP